MQDREKDIAARAPSFDWDHSEARDLYVRIWRDALTIMLGWTDAQVADFIAGKGPDLYDEFSFIYHEEPTWHLLPAIIQNLDLSDRSAEQLRELDHRIQESLRAGPNFKSTSEDYDWRAARERVRVILREAGLSDSVLTTNSGGSA